MALQHWPVTALVVSPAFSTPTGARMPDRHKQQVLALAEQYDLAVIEDDIYGELHFDVQRPRTLYSFDAGRQGRVLLCSSFSKSLSRDIRLGWIAPGRYFEAVKHLKLVTNLASSQSLQRGVSHYLQQGAFDRYLRQRRQQLKLQCVQWQQAIPDLVPAALSCSMPQGGLSFWLELAQGFDMLALYGKAREQQITLTPGRLFTAQERYQSFLRISFEQPLDEPRRQCLQRLQQLLTQSQV
jgi:DNA-binding transcriptional MocR family regulator